MHPKIAAKWLDLRYKLDKARFALRSLMIMVSAWRTIILFYFGLLAPPNAATALALSAASLSVAGFVFLMSELDNLLGEVVEASSQPMTHAIQQLAK